MARPRKENLDYFPFDVVFFGDKKIKRLKAQFGPDGICVYLFILCEAYQTSYYAVWDEDLELDISEYFGFPTEKTRQIIHCLLSRSLLESIPVKSVKVLTARSLQLRYQEAKKGAKRDIFVDERIWLLGENETEPFIKMRSVGNKGGINDSISVKNHSISGKNPTKESKEKERKVKESKVCIELPCRNGAFGITEEQLTDLTHTYPDMNVEESLQKLRNYLTANPQKQGYTSSVIGYIQMWLSEDDKSGKYRRQNKVCNATYDISEYEGTSVTDGDW